MVYGFNLITIFLMNDEAVTAIEYAIIAGLIAVVIVGAVQALGEKASTLYNLIVSVFPS